MCVGGGCCFYAKTLPTFWSLATEIRNYRLERESQTADLSAVPKQQPAPKLFIHSIWFQVSTVQYDSQSLLLAD